MKFGDKQAVGIDISQQRISIALLRTGQNGPELVKWASAPMPDGAVKDGNIEDLALLANAIKELKRSSKIGARRAAVSLYARPAVIQILDMPKQMPANIRQYVSGEVKNCVVLPSRDVVLDFCAIGAGRRSADKKLLAVAAEEARMNKLIRVCGTAGLRIETIEPTIFAYLRAIYSKKLAGKNGINVLAAILRDETLTLCVLKNSALDFIRIKDVPAGPNGPDEVNRRLIDELSEVIKFYDIEVPENTGKWNITVFVEDVAPAKALEEHLKSKIKTGLIQIRTIDDACQDVSVHIADDQKDEKASPVAVGLAARFFKEQANDVRINLVPQQVIKVREAKRDVLVAANAVAVLWLIMVLAINGFSFMMAKITRATITDKEVMARHDTELMIQQHQNLDSRLDILSTRLKRLSQISASYNDVNLVELLDDIRNATPGSVMITSISYTDGTRLIVEGLAMSNEAVDLFVGLLEKSRVISMVTLLEARKQDGQKGLIIYQLGCKLKNRSPGVPG
ncbi:MAG: pilus assembly protein PilM [Sedimentisphaerales bacterium]|nr:pilus assembly protein PilM [Sedimentisphaerales bacterium]